MTLPSTGPISMGDLNTEFGRTSTLQLSFNQAFGGTYAQTGAINRNTTAGQTIYAINNGGTDFSLTAFYDYNDLESNYWDYTFDNQSAPGYDITIEINLSSTQIYNNTLNSGVADSSRAYVNTTNGGGGNLDMYLSSPSTFPPYVDISVTDPDTSATIYSVTNDDPNNYPRWTTLASIAGYQRFQFSMLFHM